MHARANALISQVADLRSELLRASLCLDLLLYRSKQITIEYLHFFLYLVLSTSTPSDAFFTGPKLSC